MRALRQGATGLLYGLLSLILVVGSLAIALAQNPSSQQPGATLSAPATTTSTSKPSPAGTLGSSAVPLSATLTLAGITPAATTPSAGSAASTATRALPTSTAVAKAACGPPFGWVRAYTVQSGDTLYRIATSHGITVLALQRANCRTSTLIFAGERLWVPYASPPATELTVIPTFPTPTEPATDTPEPSATPATPDP